MRTWTALWLVAVGIGAVTPELAHAEDHDHPRVLSLDKVPAKARAALTREANGAPILRVELETMDGKTVYEGVVKRGDEEVAIVVDAEGRVLGHHAEKDDDEHR